MLAGLDFVCNARWIEKSLSRILSFLLDGEARACGDKRPWRSALTPIQLLFHHAENLPTLTVSQNLQVIHIQMILLSSRSAPVAMKDAKWSIQSKFVKESQDRSLSLFSRTGLTRMDMFRAEKGIRHYGRKHQMMYCMSLHM